MEKFLFVLRRLEPKQVVGALLALGILIFLVVMGGSQLQGAAQRQQALDARQSQVIQSPTPDLGPVPTPTVSPTTTPSPSPIGLTIMGRAIDDSQKTKPNGAECESTKVKAGDTVTLDPGGARTTLDPGAFLDGQCSFTFYFKNVKTADTYTIQIEGQAPAKFDHDDLEHEIADIVARAAWTKAESAYLKAIGTDPESEDAELDVETGHESCGQIEDYKGDELVAYLIEETSEDGHDRLAAQYLCGHAREAKAAARGFNDGTYTVGKGKDLEPGTYETLPGVRDCYWERVDDRGNIRSNEFVSFAPDGVEITLLETGGGFVARGCGAWLRR